MLRTVILAALALACLSSVAEARHYRAQPGNQIGCSQPDMRPCDTDGARVSRRGNAALSRVERRGSRPRAWCGWWLGRHLGRHDRSLWLARNWAGVGRPSHGPAVGAIVVWRHHVGIITGKTARGWVVKSGNDGNAVRERVRSVAGAIAFRWP